MLPIHKSLKFWTLLAGLAGFVAKYFFPTFPLDETSILALLLFLLGLVEVVPQFQANRAITVSIVNSLAFWQLIAGILVFIVNYYVKDFPFDVEKILMVILFVLGSFGIHPELRLRKFVK